MRAAWLVLAVACTPAEEGDTEPAEPSHDCSLPWPPPRPMGLRQRWAGVPMWEPTALHPVPGGGWLLLQRDGLLRWLDDDPASTSAPVALDLRDRVFLLRDTGATGFAVSPTFEQDGLIAIVYSAEGGTSYLSRVSRFRRVGDGFDPASEEVVLEVDQYHPNAMHGHGDVAYGPDGMLYVGLGDGGPFYDPHGHGQDPFDLWGSILRVDPLDGGGYAVPQDNPFADGADGAAEVWAWGLRNPFRFAFDADGALYAGDIGHVTREEVDRILPGRNYGWPVWEGDACWRWFDCFTTAFEPPVVAYGRTVGRMVVAGTTYRGARVPQVQGQYVFADMISGTLMGFDGTDLRVLADTGQPLVDLVEGADGELLAVSYGGAAFDVVAAPGPFDSDFPATLSATGCVDPGDPSVPAPDLLPYDVNVPFWSDWAAKDRWVSLPGEPMAVEGDRVVPPPGSVLVKRFQRAGRTVETRLLARHLDGSWAGYTYAWDGAQRDAVLVATDGARTFDFLPGEWLYPSRAECGQCHNGAAGPALGLELDQLGDQPDAWAQAGLLTGLDGADRSHPLPDTADGRAWVHTNCAMCHRPGGPTPVAMDLRWDTPLVAMGICEVVPDDPHGIDDARIVAPGDPDRSVLVRRIEDGSMPPLAHVFVDANGAALVRAWVAGLPGCD